MTKFEKGGIIETVVKGGICYMQKNKKKLSLIKIIIVCLILVLLSGVGVMAVTTQVNTVKIQLSNGYEMTVLTSKTNVKEILEDNNIILENNEKVTPNIDEEISSNKTIKITDKSNQEIEVAKVSESGIETSLDTILGAYSQITEKIVEEEETIPFETITKDVSDGASSTKNKVLQEGVEGKKKVTYKVKYQNDTEIEKNKISEETIQEPVNKIIQVSSNVITSRSEGSTRGRITGTVAEYQEYARERCSAYGWSDGEFGALVKLWNRESGWNPNTRNSSSGAYGIPQALPASKMASAGSDYMTNYKTQINWGLSYIRSRYGSPSSAWSYFQSNGWY